MPNATPNAFRMTVAREMGAQWAKVKAKVAKMGTAMRAGPLLVAHAEPLGDVGINH
jgi:hypothetical protein